MHCFQVEELVALSLNQPVRLFVDNNTDVAHNLRQEFVRIRTNREDDRLAIITGKYCPNGVGIGGGGGGGVGGWSYMYQLL